MALLTADEVHYKQFLTTKFREGYDQEEVDEFLDEVVETIASLTESNATLTKQLEAANAGQPIAVAVDNSHEVAALTAQLDAANQQIQQLQQAAASGDENATAQIQQLQAELAQLRAHATSSENTIAELTAELEQARAAAAAAPDAPAAAVTDGATGMLALAQRVHDEYVRDGQEEGQRIVTEAREKGEGIVREANEERRRVLEQLEGERSELQGKVDELQAFEHDYRSKISEHLEQLLGQVRA